MRASFTRGWFHEASQPVRLRPICILRGSEANWKECPCPSTAPRASRSWRSRCSWRLEGGARRLPRTRRANGRQGSWKRSPTGRSSRLLLLNDSARAPCLAAEAGARADAALSARIAAEFVLARADRVARPDLADAFGLALREPGRRRRSSAPGRGDAGRTALPGTRGAGHVRARRVRPLRERGRRGLLRAARSGLDARAAAVAETLRAAQTPAPPVRPFGPDAVESAVRAGWAGRSWAAPTARRTRRSGCCWPSMSAPAGRSLAKAATATLDLRLARGAPAVSLTAEEALRLGTWTRAFAVAGSRPIAPRPRGPPTACWLLRDAEGLFAAHASDPRLVAQVNGLAIGALALWRDARPRVAATRRRERPSAHHPLLRSADGPRAPGGRVRGRRVPRRLRGAARSAGAVRDDRRRAGARAGAGRGRRGDRPLSWT